MQTNHLWTVDICGSVQALDIKTRQWLQLSYQRLEFKRVSASPQSLWAIGGDHQIYIYVPSTDVPIRVCALTYENQRWNPLTQFSSTLLPTDRPVFSCADGTLALPKDGFALPSKSWQWESDWYIDNNIEGEPLGIEGWTYAIDFPMKFASGKSWNSLVRRRRWLRFRRYVSVNEWALLESVHDDFVAEPFIDIATGGYDIPGANKDCLAVWAVTVIGRVMFRTGVEKLSPEGVSWINVEVPTGWEVNQISCGPTGLVWAIAWDGSALVRSGVSRENISGNNWLRVEPPVGSKLLQVSVGIDAVWALTRDGKVLFRKGVRGLNSGHNDMSATGSGWVEMMQEMALVSVTPNDQVWGLSADKKSIFFRTGISYGELTGKSWKLMARQPIPAFNQKIVNTNKNIEQEMDSLSVSSQDSCFSTAPIDTQTQAWIWISAANCALNTDPYANTSSSSQGSLHSLNQSSGVISVDDSGYEECEWRSDLMKQFKQRYEREMKDFDPAIYKKSVESGTWIKSGTCSVAKTDKSSTQWCPGLIEMERQGSESNTESGTLSISYSQSPHTSKTRLSKTILNLAEISCAFIDSTDSGLYSPNNCLIIITNTVYKLKFRSEPEMEDWVATINLVCGELHGIRGSTATSSPLLYCLTTKGDLYVGHQMSCDHIFYRLLCGGHFRSMAVASNVLWALSYDNVVWVYNYGTGGGIYKGMSGVNSYCNPMSDTMTFTCYENQRWNPLTGFAPKGLPTDRYMWSDETGKYELTKECIKLPSRHWQWLNDWAIDYMNANDVDSEGWQYAIDFPFEYHPKRQFTDYVRRRRWFRKCKLTTSGPFTDLAGNPIISCSIHCSNYSTKAADQVILNVWAVSSEGEALCRLGVTRLCPRGLSWQHVSCDQPLAHISVGGDEQSTHVWAIARDGSAFLRHGLSRKCPTGTVWFHVESPRPHCPLKLIAVGKLGVWAIDEKKRLWFREEIVATFPEGTHWRKVDDSVQQISADCDDQLWAIVRVQESDSSVDRMAKRIGIDDKNRVGTEWQFVSKQWNALQMVCAVEAWDQQKNTSDQ